MNKTESNTLEIRAVTDKKAMKAFIRVPFGIYKDDPNWVPPLMFDRKEAFSSKHPFFKHVKWQAWIAHQGGQPVGRISAQIDELHQKKYGNKTGFFGLIEAPDDHQVFSALFATAESWLRENGMQQSLGPFNLGINQELGILVEGFETPPYVMTTHSRPYYAKAIEACGYQFAQEMLGYEAKIDSYEVPPIMQDLMDRCSDTLKARPLNKKNMKADFEVMREVFNDAWHDNWNSVPFTEEEFLAIGKELLMVVPEDFIQIVEFEGQPAAFIVLLPDINEVIADLKGRLLPFGWARLLWRLKVRFPKGSRIPLMGVKRQYQKTMYGPAMAYMAIQAAFNVGIAKGLQKVEMSWILKENKGVRNIIEKFGSRINKRYHMYSKKL